MLAVTLACMVLFAGAPGRLIGQSETAQNPVTTLRVFENLIQIPVVVLGPTFELMRPFPSNRFFVSLDSGPPFQATHVRFEGEDPIALSILVDVSAENDPADDLGRALARLNSSSLRSQDRLSISVLRHCEMWQAVKNQPPELKLIGERIGSIKKDWPGGWKKQQDADCRHEVLLLGALTQVIHQSFAMEGRRVVLVLSDGWDAGSKQGWAEVGSLAAVSGVAVFGLKEGVFQRAGFSGVDWGSGNPFRTLCESSGGLVFSRTPTSLEQSLKAFLHLLRERYIVQFPRPDEIEKGRHLIQVTIPRSNAFVRSAGISVPIADPSTLADPNTLRSDPGHAPTVGKRPPTPTTPQ